MRRFPSCVLVVALASPIVAAHASVPPSPPVSPVTPPAGTVASVSATSAARLLVETLGVDRRGTWSLGTDVADLLPGGAGVLKKSATLVRRGTGPEVREMVEMSVRLTAEKGPTGACTVHVDSTTRGVVSGAQPATAGRKPDRTRATLLIEAGRDKLVTAYASEATQGRLTLRIVCGAPPPAASAAVADGAQPILFVLEVSRADGEEEPALLKSDEMRAIVGREAADSFSFNRTLGPDASGGARYRREQLEVTIGPRLLSGGRLETMLAIRGELATLGASGLIASHPVEKVETLVLAPGEPSHIDLDLRGTAADEGWERVRYRLILTPTF